MLESATAFDSIINEGYRFGKISGDDIYRQRGFDNGFRMGLIAGKLSGTLVAECSALGPEFQRSISDIVQNLYDLNPDTIVNICEQITQAAKKSDASVKDRIDEFRQALLDIENEKKCDDK